MKSPLEHTLEGKVVRAALEWGLRANALSSLARKARATTTRGSIPRGNAPAIPRGNAPAIPRGNARAIPRGKARAIPRGNARARARRDCSAPCRIRAGARSSRVTTGRRGSLSICSRSSPVPCTLVYLSDVAIVGRGRAVAHSNRGGGGGGKCAPTNSLNAPMFGAVCRSFERLSGIESSSSTYGGHAPHTRQMLRQRGHGGDARAHSATLAVP